MRRISIPVSYTHLIGLYDQPHIIDPYQDAHIIRMIRNAVPLQYTGDLFCDIAVNTFIQNPPIGVSFSNIGRELADISVTQRIVRCHSAGVGNAVS